MTANDLHITMNRILFHSLVIVAALAAVGTAAGAFLGGGTSSGITFAQGVMSMYIGDTAYYNGAAWPESTWVDTAHLADEGKLFFNFTDVKPLDLGEDTISLHVSSEPAWACMQVALTSDDDLSSTEPELDAGDTPDNPADVWDGELGHALHFIWWADDGDNVLEQGEPVLSGGVDGVESLYDLAKANGPFSVALADSAHNAWTGTAGQPLAADTEYHIGKAWCLGTLTPTPLVNDSNDGPLVRGPGVTCTGTDLVGNRLQTDGVTLDVSFSAEQSDYDPSYVCSQPLTPEVACTKAQTYADRVVSVAQGLLRDGVMPVLTARSDPTKALGAPQSLGTPYDDTSNSTIANSFYSLGFASLPDHPAELVLAFDDNYVVNGLGNDLKLWEVTGGTSYPDEKVDVYVGSTPTGPWTQVGFAVTRDAEIDLGSVSAARYVKLVDVTPLASFPLPTYADADGFDLDAVQALNCVARPAQP